jgi:hypothetical protein
MRLKDLCLIFGVTPTRASKILKDMFPLAIGTLKSLPSSRVKFPNQEKMAFYAILIRRRKPEVDHVIGFVDGLCAMFRFRD